MLRTLEDNELMRQISSVLEDVVFISSVMLRGKLLSSKKIMSFNELADLIQECCRDSFCYTHLRIYDRSGMEIGEARILVYDGTIIGATLSLSNKAFSGKEALRQITDLLENSGVKALIYTIDTDTLSDQAKSILYKVQEKITGEKEEAVSRTEEGREAQVREPGKEILEKLREKGIPVINVIIAEGKNYVVIDIVCDEEKNIPDPKNVMLLALRYYLELTSECYTGKIRIAIHHRKTFSKTLTLNAMDTAIHILVGLVIEELWNKHLLIDKYAYKFKNDTLELSFVLRRTEIYSTMNIQDIVKAIYDRVKSRWKGRLVVKAKIGTWGLEAKYPR